ncbi:unnamed protein product [Lampetra planeri]
MLWDAYKEMAAVYDPPLTTLIKLLQRRQGEAKTALVYCSALMVLGQAAYPLLNQAALDSLIMDKMLGVAMKMGVVLSVTEEDVQTYLWAARCLEAHENMRRCSRVAAWTWKPNPGDSSATRLTTTAVGVAEESPEPEAEVAAAVRGWDRR